MIRWAVHSHTLGYCQHKQCWLIKEKKTWIWAENVTNSFGAGKKRQLKYKKGPIVLHPSDLTVFASTHSCTASFFSSFSSWNVDVVWTPCDVTSITVRFWSVVEGDGERAAGLPGLLVFAMVVVVEGVAMAPPGVPAATNTTPSSAPSRPAVAVLSRAWRSFALSAASLGGLVSIGSKGGSEFELDCNWEGNKSVRGGRNCSDWWYCENKRDTYPKIYTKFL